jgi:protoporphyrin/coproporphyrin ferrochelatase
VHAAATSVQVLMRTAIVLMNLGGPDSLEAVRPFLYNLFSDPAIIRLPRLLRLPLARLISWRRAPTARQIYARLGGGSPLHANSQAQASALEAVLGPEHRCFVAMRYWHPTSVETVREVADWAPDTVVCLPLYPQFSTTTTASSLAAWRTAAAAHGLDRSVRVVCCYPTDQGFVDAVAESIRPVLERATGHNRPPRLLLTAHGLPKKIVRAGDPYQGQVESTAAAVIAALGRPGVDWRICYQSRVGPLEWIGPATDEEIRRAGREGVPLVVAPISFVSEHSETLVELDIEYRHLAAASGVPAYHRVPTVGTAPGFIESLALLVRQAAGEGHVGSCPLRQPWCAVAGASV